MVMYNNLKSIYFLQLSDHLSVSDVRSDDVKGYDKSKSPFQWGPKTGKRRNVYVPASLSLLATKGCCSTSTPTSHTQHPHHLPALQGSNFPSLTAEII